MSNATNYIVTAIVSLAVGTAIGAMGFAWQTRLETAVNDARISAIEERLTRMEDKLDTLLERKRR